MQGPTLSAANIHPSAHGGQEPRAAMPGPPDLEAVAAIHDAAFAASAITQLGGDVVSAYYRWLAHDPHTLAFALARGAKGKVQGYVVVTSRPPLSAFMASHWRQLVGASLMRPQVVLKHWRHSQEAWRKGRERPPAPGGPRLATLLVIAVRPDAQGAGIGAGLEAKAMQAAVEAGFHGLDLKVHSGNAGAVRFYERLGWTAESAIGSHAVRMTKCAAAGPG